MGTADVSVDRSSLLPQAKVWDAQAQVMAGIASEANSLQYSGQDGPFTDVMRAYNTARDNIVKWTGQGHQEMTSIANALVQAYQRYNTTENTNAQDAYNAVG
jgi:hypothetical protein